MGMQKTIASLLIWALTVPYLPAQAEGITDTLDKFNSGVGQIGAGMNQVGQKMGEIQMMTQQMGLIRQMGNLQSMYGQQQGTFEQVRTQLAMTMMQSGQCMTQKFANEKDKDSQTKLALNELLNREVTCGNATENKAAAKAYMLQLDHASQKINCLQTLQNKFEQVAKGINQPFSQLTTAARENVHGRDQVIDQYKKIAEQITNDLDGKNGYKAQLADLKNMRKSLIDALSRGGKQRQVQVGGDELAANLGQRIDNLRTVRNNVANMWHKQLMTHTLSCFQSMSVDCGDGGSPASPLDCVRRQSDVAAANSTGQRFMNDTNKREIDGALRELRTILRRHDKSAKLDASDMNAFKEFSQERFASIADRAAYAFEKRNFRVMAPRGVSADQAKTFAQQHAKRIASFVKGHLAQCYNDGFQELEASIKSQSNPDYAKLISEEKDVATDINKWLQVATDKMNSFRTSFTKLFNVELAQYNSSCQAGDDPYKGIECLRNIQKALSDGIDGTNGEASTVMNVPTMQTDATGQQVTQGVRSFSCRGYEECLNMLGQARDFNKQQAETQKVARDKFVQDHNKNIDTALGGLAAQFGAAYGQLGEKIAEINRTLGGLGVTGAIDAKTVEGETLTKDRDGLYNQPKDMMAALAGKAGFVKMDGLDKVLTGVGDRRKAIIEAGQKASKMEADCKVSDRDYRAVLQSLVASCDPVAVCAQIQGTTSALEKLLRKSQTRIEQNQRQEITDQLRDCQRSAGQISDDDLGIDDISESSQCKERVGASGTGESQRDAMARCQALERSEKAERRRLRQEAKLNAQRGCTQSAAMALSQLNDNGRGDLPKKHGEFLNAFRELAASCPLTSPPPRRTAAATTSTSGEAASSDDDSRRSAETSAASDRQTVKAQCESMREDLSKMGSSGPSAAAEDDGEPRGTSGPTTGSRGN